MNLQHLCRSIAMAGHTGKKAPIEDGLDHNNPKVRTTALGAAARIGLLDTAILRRFLQDEDDDVAYRALELVPTMPDGDALAEVVIAKLDVPQFSEMAAFVLGELQLDGTARDRAVAALIAQVDNHDDPLCRESAVAALGALGDGVEAILRATSDVATVRRRAVLALAPFDGPEVEAALRRACDDRDWQVRQAAEDLLADDGPAPGSG